MIGNEGLDLTVVVGTCDSYLKYMPNFITLFDRYVEPKDLWKIVVGEDHTVPTYDYTWILPGKGHTWGYRMQQAFNAVETKYIYFVLDDYYHSQKLSTDFFRFMLGFMDRNNANKLLMSPITREANYSFGETVDTIRRMQPWSDWLTSTQPAIWRTDHLRDRVNDVTYDPWDFEIKGSEKLRHKEKDHWVIHLPNDNPMYFNAVRKGNNLAPGWQEFFKLENLPNIV